MKEKVSVVMITYNHENYIREAIEGVLMQDTDFDIELIVADDNSPDQTEKIVKEILDKHPNASWIKYTKHRENKGVTPNLAFGLEQCKGKYIAICEGDDYWTDPLKLQKQVEAMEQNLDINLSFHQCDILNCIGSCKIKAKEFSKYQDLEIIELGDVIRGNGGLIPMPSIFFRSSILEDYLKYLGRYKGGHFLLQVIGSLNGALFIKQNMAVYRKNSSSSVIKNVKNNPVHYESWIKNRIEKLKDFKKITSGNYNKLIDSLILKEKINAFKSFRISQKYRKELHKDLTITKDISYWDQIKFYFLYKNNNIKRVVEKIYRLIKRF